LVRLAAAAALLLLSAPTASAQLSVTGSCLSAAPGCSLFEFVLEAPDRPVALESAEFTFLSPAWGFTSPMYEAEDLFGPFGGIGTVSGGSTLFVDFIGSAGFPMELLSPFPGLLLAEVSGVGAVSFAWTATEIDGNELAGTVEEAVAAPEPGTVLLLALGLSGLAALRCREVAS
jgi:hypothetical protein